MTGQGERGNQSENVTKLEVGAGCVGTVKELVRRVAVHVAQAEQREAMARADSRGSQRPERTHRVLEAQDQ